MPPTKRDLRAIQLANNYSQNLKQHLIGDSGVIDHLIPEQIDHPFVWRKKEQISWRSFKFIPDLGG